MVVVEVKICLIKICKAFYVHLYSCINSTVFIDFFFLSNFVLITKYCLEIYNFFLIISSQTSKKESTLSHDVSKISSNTTIRFCLLK